MEDANYGALRLIAAADDVLIVRAVERFHERLSSLAPIDALEVARHLMNTVPRTAELIEPLLENQSRDLTAGTSARAGRWLLILATEERGLAPMVSDCIEDWDDGRKSVGNTLAAGLVGAVLLTIATVSFECSSDGSCIIRKESIPPEQIVQMVDRALDHGRNRFSDHQED